MLQRIAFLLIAGVTATPGETIAGITPISRDNSNKPVPKFSNGFTIFFDRNLQTVDLYDKNASLRTTAILRLPDTGKFLISDVSASSKGILAISGTTVSNNGDRLATVIVWCGQQGQIERVVKTEPF